MAYIAKAVANEFLHLVKDEGRSVTPMQLLKLAYFAYGWHWALADARLINERVQAWKYGPVIPSIYHEFKAFGNDPIDSFATEWTPVHKGGKFIIQSQEPRIPECDDFPLRLVRRVWEVYGQYTAIQLSQMTHEPGTPWAETPNREVKGTPIDDGLIKAYFLQLAGRNDRERPAAT
jgi:uncharacterized phage-associated protein